MQERTAASIVEVRASVELPALRDNATTKRTCAILPERANLHSFPESGDDLLHLGLQIRPVVLPAPRAKAPNRIGN